MTAETEVQGISLPPGMTDEEKLAAWDTMFQKAAAYDEANAKTTGPARFKAVVSDPKANERTLFSSVNEGRVKRWIEQHCPRGQHFFLLTPDGDMLSYEAERETGGPQGEDVEMWQEFDRTAYTSPELNPVNVHDPWADAWEGAQ
jgi:hypothetical protein